MCPRAHPFTYSPHETIKSYFTDRYVIYDPIYDKNTVCLRLLEQELLKRVRLCLFRCQDTSGKNNMRYKNCPYQENAVIHHFGFSVLLSYIYLAIALFTLL